MAHIHFRSYRPILCRRTQKRGSALAASSDIWYIESIRSGSGALESSRIFRPARQSFRQPGAAMAREGTGPRRSRICAGARTPLSVLLDRRAYRIKLYPIYDR